MIMEEGSLSGDGAGGDHGGRRGQPGAASLVLPQEQRICIFALLLPLAARSWPVVMVFWVSLRLDHGVSTMALHGWAL